MQNEHKAFTRTYHNYSNINFNDSITDSGARTAQHNYRSMSQVGRLMTDQIEPPTHHSRSIYHYNNKISQVEKDYEITPANDPLYERGNTKYQQFYEKTKKFNKPYTDCTHFSDNLMKNKQLLRRGQFDLPTEPIMINGLNVKNTPSYSQVATPHKSSFNQTHTEMMKTRNLLKRNCETMENIRKRKPSSDQKLGFDKTLMQHASNYKTLLNDERKNDRDQAKLKNSMNRILAAEMINYRLLGTNNYFKPHSVRVDKRPPPL